MNFNRIIIAGHMTRDPSLTALPSGSSVCEFGLAVNRTFGSGDDKKQETCFIDIRAYGKTADVMKQYLTKGRNVLIEGRLQFQQWTGKDGQKRSKHIVVADSFQFIGGKSESGPVREETQRAEESTTDDGGGIPF